MLVFRRVGLQNPTLPYPACLALSPDAAPNLPHSARLAVVSRTTPNFNDDSALIILRQVNPITPRPAIATAIAAEHFFHKSSIPKERYCGFCRRLLVIRLRRISFIQRYWSRGRFSFTVISTPACRSHSLPQTSGNPAPAPAPAATIRSRRYSSSRVVGLQFHATISCLHSFSRMRTPPHSRTGAIGVFTTQTQVRHGPFNHPDPEPPPNLPAPAQAG